MSCLVFNPLDVLTGCHGYSDRYTGEEWLIRDVGGYLPGIYEEVRKLIQTTA